MTQKNKKQKKQTGDNIDYPIVNCPMPRIRHEENNGYIVIGTPSGREIREDSSLYAHNFESVNVEADLSISPRPKFKF